MIKNNKIFPYSAFNNFKNIERFFLNKFYALIFDQIFEFQI